MYVYKSNICSFAECAIRGVRGEVQVQVPHIQGQADGCPREQDLEHNSSGYHYMVLT